MSNQNELPEEEKFSDEPEENLRMQNDFLKMKMMAESGAFFGGEGGLLPEIENQFLKNIMEFEQGNSDSKAIAIFNILSEPVFEDEKNLDEGKFGKEYSRLELLLEDHGIKVEFSRERNNRFKYHFITKELFYHVTTFMPVKGMTTYFLYEEFHPDHELDIKNLTSQFLNDYFEKNLNKDTYYIDNHFMEPNGDVLSKEDLMKQFLAAYDVFVKIENTSFTIENINFELNEENNDGQQGMGLSEGEIKYDIIFTGGERKKIHGPFKIYFSQRWDCWEIYFFYLAGFNYHPANEK